MDTAPVTTIPSLPPSRRGLWIVLGSAGAILATLVLVYLSKWIPAGKALDRERIRVRAGIDAMRDEQVRRPTFFEPTEEGNSWELLTEGLDAIGDLEESELKGFPSFREDKDEPVPPAEEVSKLIAKVEPMLEVLWRGVRRPWVEPCYFYEHNFYLRMPLVTKSIRACKILGDRAAALHEEGRSEESVARLILGWGIADHMAVKSFMVNELVRITEGKMMADKLRSILANYRLDSKDLARLAGALAVIDGSRPDILECYRRDSLLSGYGILEVAEGADTSELYPGGRLRGMPHHFFSMRVMAADYFTIQNDLLKSVEAATRLPLRERLAELERLEKHANSKKNPLVPLLMLDLSKCWRMHALDALEVSLTRVAVAVARHREDRGALPGGLTELVPSFLPAIPADEVSGRPFSYTVKDGTAWIYSWGEDGDDDGGVPIEDEVIKDGVIRDGDIVWTVKRKR